MNRNALKPYIRSIRKRLRNNPSKRLKESVDTAGSIGKLTLSTYLPEDAVIVELGAHDGRDTEEFALLFPKGKVFAFEAQADLFMQSRRALRPYANATVIHAAVSDTSSLIEFNQSSGASIGSGSILTPSGHLKSHPDVQFLIEDREFVPQVSLKQAMDSLDIDRVDLLWMDIQGAEIRALQGVEAYLDRIGAIYTEVCSVPLYVGGATYDDLKELLSKHGFHVEREFLPSEWKGEGNVLFLR